MAVGKKLLSVFFSFALVMGLLPYSAFADPLDSSSDSTKSSSDASTSSESEFADGEVASKPDPNDSESGMDSNGSVSGGEDPEFGTDDEFANEQELSAPDYGDGKLAIWADGLDDPSDVTDVYPPDTNEIEAYADGSNLQPMSFSSEMLYFCKYESSCNYDQGLSSGDGYHAMGYFQFDNRYGLGSFLEAVYNYNPSTYSALRVIGDRYGWDVTGATRSNGAFTRLGNDLNTAWHAAYKANPTEFSNLQNGWAYIDSYNGSLGARGCLKTFGINLDNRPDCIKGLCWGMVNLFGAGGGASYINNGKYYGANWFFKNSGINDSMSDEAFVTTLCDYVVNNVAKRYPKQSIYWTGWQNRYKSEKADCLNYLQANVYVIEDKFDSSIQGSYSVSDGEYVVKSKLDGMGVLQADNVSSASQMQTALKLRASAMGDSQKFEFERDGSTGYVRIKCVQGSCYLGLAGSNGRYSQNVIQKSYSENDKTLLWLLTENNGTIVIAPAVNPDYCLTVSSDSFHDGSSVDLRKSSGADRQKWSLYSTSPEVKGGRTVEDGIYYVGAKADPSQVLDIADASSSDGANLQIWAATGAANQKFRFECGDDGFYTITCLKSGKVLDVDNGNVVPGANVQQWSGYGGDSQRWAVQDDGDGGYRLVCKANGLAIDLTGGSTADGTNVQSWTLNGTEAQSFDISSAKADRVVADGVYVVSAAADPSKVLDVEGGSLSDGARLQVYGTNMTQAQAFRFDYDEETGFYTITNEGSGKVLDAAGGSTSNGTRVQQYAPNGTLAQRWIVSRDGDGVRICSAAAPSQVLDLTGRSSSDGTKVQLWSSSGGSNQLFRLYSASPEVKGGRTVEDGIYYVGAKADPSQVLDIADASSSDGANLQIWAATGAANQKFRFECGDDGFYTITCLKSGKVLDVDNGNVVPGANVQQWSGYGGDSQRWAVQDDGDGGYRLVCKANGLAIDLTGGSTADGTNVQSWTLNGTEAQSFDISSAKADRVVADGVYVVSAAADPSKVLDVEGGSLSDGARLQVYGTNMTQAQAFRFDYDEETGFYTITNEGSGKVLDAAGGSTSNGTRVQQYAPNGTLAQRWIVSRDGDGVRICSAAAPSQVLDLTGRSSSDGTKVQLWSSSGGSNQLFRLYSASPEKVSPCDDMKLDGVFEIVPASQESLRLDVAGASRAHGAGIQLYNDNATFAQLFRLEFSNGYYRILSVNSGQAVAMSHGSVVPGIQTCQEEPSGGDEQLFSASVDDDGDLIFTCKANSLKLGYLSCTSGQAVVGTNSDDSSLVSFKLVKRTDLLKEGLVTVFSSMGDNKVLDVKNGDFSDGANVQLYDGNGTFAQKWNVTKVAGRANSYRFESVCAGKYLTADGFNVCQRGLDDSEAQIWTPRVSERGGVVLENSANDKVLDVAGASTANGTNVQVYGSNGTDAQRFYVDQVDPLQDGMYTLHIGSNYKQVVDVAGGSNSDGANIQSWESNNSGAQKWNIFKNNDGSYRIINAVNGKAMDVSEAKAYVGANVQQYTWNGSNAQKWIVRYDREAGFVFESSLNANLVLETSSYDAGNGVNIQLGTASGRGNQRFCLERTTYVPPMAADKQAMQDRIWGYWSDTQWLIAVDRSTHKVGVFKGSANNWSLQYYWSCVTGAPGTPTITGTYRTTGFKRTVLSTDSRARWCTQIWGEYFFHTILASDNELGKSLSHGCLRMSYPSAQWIYNNIYSGTTVAIYN